MILNILIVSCLALFAFTLGTFFEEHRRRVEARVHRNSDQRRVVGVK